MGRFKQWLRAHAREVVFGAILYLASSLSFGVGYLANREFNHAPIVIEQCSHGQEKTRS